MYAHHVITKVLLLGNTLISHTAMTASDYKSLVYFTKVDVYMNLTINVSYNNASTLLLFESCNVVINGKIYFIANICRDQIIGLISGTKYFIVEEYTIIKFDENDSYHLISIGDYRYNNVYFNQPNPFCLFRYVATNSIANAQPPTDHYSIIVKAIGDFYGDVSWSSSSIWYNTVHCKWIPTAAYHGHHPGPVNEKIINITSPYEQLNNHYSICLCSSDGFSDCRVDEIGPIYPGQVLSVGISLQFADKMSVLYAETYDTSVSQSGCKIAHQDELTNILDDECKTLNFTIVSNASKECELFLRAQPDMHHYYEGFYVKLLKCPEGFVLLDGVCDCDPLLSNSDLHIKTCDIEQAAIIRPANSWISNQTLADSSEYSISTTCPMDYCLPHSSAIGFADLDLQCQFNRSGILCSQCQHGLSMVFGSSRCMKCTNVHILITLIVIVAGIVLVVLLYLLNLTVTNGTINGIIFYANIVSIDDSVFLVNDNVFKPLKVFVSFINLDLGIETCYYNGMDSYAKMWLQLFFPLYLILIATFIIIASRYSYRIQRLTYTRSLPVLATLFLLSYTDILRAVSTVLFSYSTITELPSGHQHLVWSIDASVPLFGVKFTILFITCLMLFLILIPFNFILMFTRWLSQFKMIKSF